MDLALLVYAISVLDSAGHFLACIIALSVFALVISIIYRFAALGMEYWDSESRRAQKLAERVPLEKWIKRLFAILAVSVVFAIIIPSEKTAYIMVGAYATQKVAENEKVQETGKKVLTLIEQKLDAYIEQGFKKAPK